MLSAKLQPIEFASAKMRPEQSFGGGGLLAHFTGATEDDGLGVVAGFVHFGLLQGEHLPLSLTLSRKGRGNRKKKSHDA